MGCQMGDFDKSLDDIKSAYSRKTKRGRKRWMTMMIVNENKHALG